MVTWIVVAVIVLGLVVLIAAGVPILGRLANLRRAAVRLQHRQAEVLTVQAAAEELQVTLAGMEQRLTEMQGRIALIQAGRGRD